MSKKDVEQRNEEILEQIQSLQAQIDKLYDEKHGLREHIQEKKNDKAEANIRRYYINSIREAYGNRFYIVGEEINRTQYGVSVKAIDVKLDGKEGKEGYSYASVSERWLDLWDLRRTEPAEEFDVAEAFFDNVFGPLQEIAESINVDI